MNKLILLVLCGTVAAASACRRKREAPLAPAPGGAPAAEAPAASAQSPVAPQARDGSPPPAVDSLPTAPPDSSLRFPIHQELTGAVHLYLTDHRKLPADFATLVREKYLPAMPKPTPGKRFALDRNRLQVVIMD